MGADGSLYVLEWGRDFNYAGSGINPDSGLYRIDYAKGTRTPVARATADKDSGPAPLTVTFSSDGLRGRRRRRPDVLVGLRRRRRPRPRPTRRTRSTEAGTYTVRLTATDSTGKSGHVDGRHHRRQHAPDGRADHARPGRHLRLGRRDPVHGRRSPTRRTGRSTATGSTLNPGIFHDEGGNAHVHPGVSKTGCSGTIDGPGRLRPREERQHRARPRGQLHGHRRRARARRRSTGASTRRLTPKTDPGRALHRPHRHADQHRGQRGGRPHASATPTTASGSTSSRCRCRASTS